MCPSLTLQQIYKLTEHHHDDWITGGQGPNTIVLLETLKRAVDTSGLSSSSPHSTDGLNTPFSNAASSDRDSSASAMPMSVSHAEGYRMGTPGGSAASVRALEDEDSLLLDSQVRCVVVFSLHVG